MKMTTTHLRTVICLILLACLLTGCTYFDAQPSTNTNSMTIEEEIIQDFYYNEFSEADRSHCSIGNLSLRFRGAFSDTYVIFIDGYGGYFQAVTYEVIDGIKFTYSDSQHAFAYHQGSFYSLTEAYELGYLTMDDLAKMHTEYPVFSSVSDKGEVPTAQHPCTHTTPQPDENFTEGFDYAVSEAQYIYKNVRETQTPTVFVVRSCEELTKLCGIDKTQIDPKHDDNFFKSNSLIIINYFVQKSPFNILARSVTASDDGTLQVEIDSYAIDPISYLEKVGSLVLEVNRIVNDPQVKHTFTTHTVTDAEYRELFPKDTIHPLFQPDGMRFDDLTVEREQMGGSDNWYARIATSLFTDPKDVNLYDMFRNAYPAYKDFTEAELTYLHTTFLSDAIGNLDIVKIPAGEMNSMLLRYLGLNIEQVNQVGMENLVYFSETNSYYCICNDVAVQQITVHSSYYHSGYFIYYELGEPDGYPEYVMQVEYKDGYFTVLSNQKTPTP